MKTKQIIGILVAGITFILICITSMAANKYMGNMTKGMFSQFSSLKDTESQLRETVTKLLNSPDFNNIPTLSTKTININKPTNTDTDMAIDTQRLTNYRNDIITASDVNTLLK